MSFIIFFVYFWLVSKVKKLVAKALFNILLTVVKRNLKNQTYSSIIILMNRGPLHDATRLKFWQFLMNSRSVLVISKLKPDLNNTLHTCAFEVCVVSTEISKWML